MAFTGNGAVQQQVEEQIFSNVKSFQAIQAEQEAEEQDAAEKERQDAIARTNARVKFLDVNSLFSQTPAPLDFVLPGLVAGTTAALVSPGGTGKSFLGLQLAALVAGGVDTLGITGLEPWKHLRTGPVLYLSLEDNGAMLANRSFAVGKGIGLSDGSAESAKKLAALASGLRVCDVTGNVVDIIYDRDWGFWLEEQCKNHRLIILDTLRLSHTGNENDSGQMAKLMANLNAWASKGAAILFLHHTNKNAMQEGTGDSQAASRGSSVLIDNARGAFYLQSMGLNECQTLADAIFPFTEIGEGNRSRYAKFGISKANASARWPEIWLRRGDGGFLTVAQLGDPVTMTAADRKARNARKDMSND